MRVWAPRAARLTMRRGAGSVAVAVPAAPGVWTLPDPEPGEDYALSIDDGPWLPDPRSRSQPAGVHGPSRALAPLPPAPRFAAPPLEGGLIYELHVGTFSPEGTFDGAAARLDHLVALGVTHVELMPVAEFPGRWGWGYDGVALFAARQAYGGRDGLRRLVEACHARGLAVILDVVYNHLGPDGNYLGQYGPYFTDRHRTAWGDAVNLDGPGSDEVRQFLVDNALGWLGLGLDGLRLDAIHAFADERAYGFVEQLADEVRQAAARWERRLILIAETDRNDPVLVRERGPRGVGIHAQWNDDFHHAVHALLTGERSGYYADYGTLEALRVTLLRGWLHEGGFSRFRGRAHGRPFGATPRDRLVAFTQSHDQIGNRAQGERLIALCGPARAQIAAALLFVSPFTPMLFQGEEWGASTPFLYFTDHESPALAEAVREGRRREHPGESVPPDPQAEATFRRSALDWSEPGREPHASLLAWMTKLAALRRAHPPLRDPHPGSITVELDESRGWIMIARGPFLLGVNLGATPVFLPMGGVLHLASGGATRQGEGTYLPPDSCALVQR